MRELKNKSQGTEDKKATPKERRLRVWYLEGKEEGEEIKVTVSGFGGDGRKV